MNEERLVAEGDFYDDLDSSSIKEDSEVVVETRYDSEDEFFQQVNDFAQNDPELSEADMNELMNIDKPNGSTRGCVAYALYGNCYKGKDCKYVQGHNDAVAKETRKWMIKKLSQMSNDEADNPRKIIPRPGGRA